MQNLIIAIQGMNGYKDKFALHDVLRYMYYSPYAYELDGLECYNLPRVFTSTEDFINNVEWNMSYTLKS